MPRRIQGFGEGRPGREAGISVRKVGGGGGQGNSNSVQEQEQVPGSDGDKADGDRGGKSQESYLEERTQEKARKARREFGASVGAFL